MEPTTEVHFRLQLIDEVRRITVAEWGEPKLHSVVGLLMAATDRLAKPKRNNPTMDYSVGGPLWLEWQRIQTHSEWDRWEDLYDGSRHAINRWKVYYDWLLENCFDLESSEVQAWAILTPETYVNLHKPAWKSVNESSDSEPVEGAA